MRPWKSRAGQIVIPAMLLFPTLFLFVYLIYETAKLSREKIKHQFAMDAAAFVEATNYSDFLNRTAYVNGAFPMRIFEQGYDDFPAECEGKVEHCEKITYAEILYKNGIFPRSKSGKKEFRNEETWDHESIRNILGITKDDYGLAPAPGGELQSPDLLGTRLTRQLTRLRERSSGGGKIVSPAKL